MGGGGAIRAAAKVAGLSDFAGTFRSGGGDVGGGSAFENPVSVAARIAARPVCATVIDAGKKAESPAHRPVWELDDWDFAYVDGESEGFVSDKNGEIVGNSPRIVFGPVPTLEETKEATSELKQALDQMFLSSPRSFGSSKSLASENEACIIPAPKGAMQAFSLLKENPAAQTVVASIASDPNVWVAVMQNSAFVEFLESDRRNAGSETQNPLQSSDESSVDNDDAEEPGKPDGFMGFIEDVKVTVIDMVSNLTSFVESLFNTLEKDEELYDSPKTTIAGNAFMALAMMVIMVILMKRN